MKLREGHWSWRVVCRAHHVPLRQCAQSDGTSSGNSPCGFPYAGLCRAVCSTASPYSSCAFAGGTAHAEVVTTYLYGTPQ